MLKTNDKNFDFSASTLQEAQKIAEILASSELVPSDYRGKPNNVLVAVQFGAEIGLKPLQSLQGIAVINGRPCVWGDALLSVAMGHKDFEDIIEEIDEARAMCTVIRKGRKPCVRTFSVEDAKRAGLYNRKGPWMTYPQRMLQMRARSWAIRDSFADVLKGIQTREEVEDMPRERTVNVNVVEDAPKMSNSQLIRKQIQERSEHNLGLNYEKNNQQEDSNEVIVEDVNYQLLLNNLINNNQIPAAVWSPWLAKARVNSISELDDDQAKKCIDYINQKYNQGSTKETIDKETGEVFDAKNFMEQ